MSEAWPWTPPEGWCIRIRAWGRAKRLPVRAGAEQELAHRGGEAHADGADVGADELHGVVDGHAGGDRATGRVDVEPDVLLGVLALEVEELGGDQVGDLVVDLRAEEDDALLEQAVVDVLGRIAPGALGHRDVREVGGLRHGGGGYRWPIGCHAGVAELEDAPGLGPGGALPLGGSSPLARTR